MKLLKLTTIAAALLLTAPAAGAQVVKRTGSSADRNKKAGASGLTVTGRQQSFYEVTEPSDADLQWMKVV